MFRYLLYFCSLNADSPPMKRQLYAFPRVGRSDKPHAEYQLSPQLQELLFGSRSPFTKRQSIETSADQFNSKDNMAMWFGPRLGRSFPIEDDGELL